MPIDRVQTIIDAVGADVLKPHRTWRGVDLDGHKASLRVLLQEIAETYDAARNDWDSRNTTKPFDPLTGQGKPPKRLSCKDSKRAASPYDYGKDAGAGFSETWVEHWQRFYGRRAGAPHARVESRASRTTQDCILDVVRMVERHCRETLASNLSDGDNPRKMNPSGRLLLLVAQEACDSKYQAANCHSVYSRLRETPKMKKRRADRQRERVKHARSAK